MLGTCCFLTTQHSTQREHHAGAGVAPTADSVSPTHAATWRHMSLEEDLGIACKRVYLDGNLGL